jgi:plastocyanin
MRAALALLAALAALAACATCVTVASASSRAPSTRVRRHAPQTCVCDKHHRCKRKKKHRRARCVTPKPAARVVAPPKAPSPAAPIFTAPTPSAAGLSPEAGSSPATPAPPEPPPTPTETPPAPAPAHVEVTAEDTSAFRFLLSRPTVPAGQVIIEFVNHGQGEHTLNVTEPPEESVDGSIPNTQPDGHPSISLTMSPGSYTLFCSIGNHAARGMKATLVVE